MCTLASALDYYIEDHYIFCTSVNTRDNWWVCAMFYVSLMPIKGDLSSCETYTVQ